MPKTQDVEKVLKDAKKGAEDNAEVSEEPRSDDAKCDNHPHRKARTFTANGAIAPIHLCDECTPPWFQDDEPVVGL